MSFLISMLLPFLAALILIAGTSIAWWRSLPSPQLFVIVGFLALLGVHRMLQAGVEFLKFFRGGGYFLEARTNPNAIELALESITRESVAVSLLILLVGFPLLLWLKRALLVA